MLDFFQISTKEVKGGVIEVRPDFTVGRSKDLMVRGQSFYAIWDDERGIWSTDEFEVQRLMDAEIDRHADKMKADGISCSVKHVENFNNGGWTQFRKFMKNISDNSHQLDANVVFSNTEAKKTDYVTRRLSYSLASGPHPAYDELMGTLYEDEELTKIEWVIGAIIAGDSKKIQKFLALYGPPGSGKGTALDIIKKLFPGYYTTFEAKDLVASTSNFATEAFKDNPLIGIDPDAKLDRIEDNTKFNKITGHDELRLNEKYKPTYTTKINTFVIIATNDPVKITNSKSGIIRRLIDVRPSGNLVDADRYHILMMQIDFELGAIASHCLDRYRGMGKNAYQTYRPVHMMRETDVFLNYVEAHFDIFKEQDGASLSQAYALYKEYAKDSELKFVMPRYKFREELKNYFDEFHDRLPVNGTMIRSYFTGFSGKAFKMPTQHGKVKTYSLVLDEDISILDEELSQQPAQYSNEDGFPIKKWENVDTTLFDLDTSQLHFVKVPENHIVIDFDLKGDDGEKSLERNLEAAATGWPATYAEFSKSGAGVHLHYLYTGGDVADLAAGYSDGIEIKVYRGNSSLRRKLTKCNNIPIATINGGLPFKEKKTVLDTRVIQSEKGLREQIARNLRKEIHDATKPSIDMIKKILDDAYASGMVYDVMDLRPKLMKFANESSNQALLCIKTVQKMKFKSDATVEESASVTPSEDDPIVIFDCEVYPNLFVICWKFDGADGLDSVVRMINPSSTDVEKLFKFKLVGFYNRDYDNHILYGRFMGMNNEQLYQLSKRLVTKKDHKAKFGEAYQISYADVLDIISKKQSLKKWEIELGLRHMEMSLPWDEPVPPELWDTVVEYCANDVMATEAVLHAREQDFVARKILADLSGLTVNDPTRSHATKIIFGRDRRPQDKFIYTDLSKEFPGYTYNPYVADKSTYRGEVVGEGGYVYAEPGIHTNVEVLDVASMHPTTIEKLDLFGEYTKKFSELKNARLMIKSAVEALKQSDFRLARLHIADAGVMLNGKLRPYLTAPEGEVEGGLIKRLLALSEALKLVINSVYGYTAATFDNEFRDPRNIDNIVAKRGALFMIDLKNYVQELGYTVAHIKTDSIKIPNATPEIIEAVKEFGKKYGYDFDHEATYKKMCLVNQAVYIARKDDDSWEAVGAQFQHPVVFKALFTGEPITFNDLCELKSVREGAIYLDFDETEATPATPHKGMHFVGKTGLFVPVTKAAGGAKLVRLRDGKVTSIGGAKDYLWLEAEMVRMLNLNAVDRMLFEDLTQAVQDSGSITDVIDMTYYEGLANDAIEAIDKYGKYSEFVK